MSLRVRHLVAAILLVPVLMQCLSCVVATDDAALVERYGGRVVVVEGDDRNIKITRREDLVLGEVLLRAEKE